MDKFSVANVDGNKDILAIKLRVDGKPVVFMGMYNRGGRASHTMHLSPVAAATLADWLLESVSTGWGDDPVPLGRSPRAPEPETTVGPLDLRRENAGVVCYVLHVLKTYLPAEYGPAWIVAHLAAAGVPLEWDSKAERFSPRTIGAKL